MKTAEKYARARQLDEEADGLDDSANILIEHLATIQEQTTAVVYHQTIQEHLKERDNLRNEAESIRKGAKLSFDKGPLVRQLDATLQKFRVARQAYHGKSFVGNHVHRCCQVLCFSLLIMLFFLYLRKQHLLQWMNRYSTAITVSYDNMSCGFYFFRRKKTLTY